MRQHVAFFLTDALPIASDFEEVVCNDFSAAGISFFLDQPPRASDLVISLGVEAKLAFMAAQVRSYRPAFNNGKRCYQVRCQFTRRLPPGVYRWNQELGCMEVAPPDHVAIP